MASDSSVTIGNHRVPVSPKMWRLGTAIIGTAGNLSHAEEFAEWFDKREGRQPKGDYSALCLYRDGRISWFHPGHKEKFIEEDFFSIGSGEGFALGAFEAMRHMGLPLDPRIAVHCACMRDTFSAEPIKHLRWKSCLPRSKPVTKK